MDGSEFVGVLENAGLEPRKYSGRFMCGRSCPSVETSWGSNIISEMIQLVADAASVALDLGGREDWEAFEDFVATAKGVRWDSMGLGVVLYWPEVEWPGDREESDKCEECARSRGPHYSGPCEH